MSPKGEKLKDEGTRTQVVIAGASAGLVSRFCIAPLDVVKIRLQLQIHSLSDPLSHEHIRGPIYKGTLGTFRAIVREEGFRALWKGNVPAELLYVSYGASQFSMYKATTKFLRSLPRPPPDSAESFISGAFAGGVATTMTYPLDLLRTRFAAQGSEKIYANLRAGIRDIAKHEGPRGFFTGLSAAVGQIVPYMGLFFMGYEAFKVPLTGYNLPFGSGDAVAGVLASISAKSAVYPLDTVRKRLQVQGPTRRRYIHKNIPLYQGVIGTFRTVYRQGGMRSFYRGLPVSLIKAAPTSAVTMFTYERAMQLLQNAERHDD